MITVPPQTGEKREGRGITQGIGGDEGGREKGEERERRRGILEREKGSHREAMRERGR